MSARRAERKQGEEPKATFSRACRAYISYIRSERQRDRSRPGVSSPASHTCSRVSGLSCTDDRVEVSAELAFQRLGIRVGGEVAQLARVRLVVVELVTFG